MACVTCDLIKHLSFVTYMLYAGWEVCIVKNCGPGLEMLPKATGEGQHFQARGHSFSLYGPTLSQQITCLFFPALNWFYRLQMACEPSPIDL